MAHSFRVLGPVELLHCGSPIHLRGRKQQVFLLALLLNLNRPVSLRALSEILWDVEPPPSATSNIRTYAAGLRRSMSTTKEVSIVADSGSYLLVMPPELLDLTRFEELLTAAHSAMYTGDFAIAVERFGEALALWRGPVGAGLLYGNSIAARVYSLHEKRAVGMQDRAAAQLAIGWYTEAADGMRLLLSEEPLRERAWELLIRALYASGDTTGAIGAYAKACACIKEGLGLEPGDRLRLVHKAILAGQASCISGFA